MIDIETRLQNALEAGAPAPRDPMFRVEVLIRRERAMFRRRVLAGGVTALGVAILASVVFGLVGDLAGSGATRLAALAAVGVVLTALLAAPYVGAGPALRRVAGLWRARASWTTPRLRLWS